MKLLNKNQIKEAITSSINKNPEIVNILEEIDETEGLVNQIFKVDVNNIQFVIKQVLPFPLALSKYREEIKPINPNRIILEAKALIFLNQIYPGIAPEIFKIADKKGLLFMQDLTQFKNLRYALTNEETYPNLGKTLGELLARLRYFTSRLYLDQEEFEKLKTYFENKEYREMLTDMVLGEESTITKLESFEPEVREYQKSLIDDPEIKEKIKNLREYYKKTEDCFSHLDLHSGNLLVKPEDIKILDCEFSGMGTSSMDLGRIASSFLINYLYFTKAHSINKRKMLKFDLDTIRDIYQTYYDSLKKYTPEKADLIFKQIFMDSLKMLSLSVILRLQSGIALSYDISQLKNRKDLVAIQKEAFEFLETVFKKDSIHTIDELIDYIKNNFK